VQKTKTHKGLLCQKKKKRRRRKKKKKKTISHQRTL
jgi:hypothetical protein